MTNQLWYVHSLLPCVCVCVFVYTNIKDAKKHVCLYFSSWVINHQFDCRTSLFFATFVGKDGAYVCFLFVWFFIEHSFLTDCFFFFFFESFFFTRVRKHMGHLKPPFKRISDGDVIGTLPTVSAITIVIMQNIPDTLKKHHS